MAKKTYPTTHIPCVVNQNYYSNDLRFIDVMSLFRDFQEKKDSKKKSKNENSEKNIECKAKKLKEALDAVYNQQHHLTSLDLNNKDKYNQVKLLSFNNQKSDKEEKLVFELCKKEIEKKPQYYVKTGLYTGIIYVGNLQFSIDTGYGVDNKQLLLHRMLRYANNIFIENDDKGNADKNKENGGFPLFEFLFLTSLQKAAILGFPQEYTKTKFHELKVHGNIDVARYITNDIPFKGKIASVKNERKYVQCVIDVLYFALKTVHDEIKKENFSHLSFVKSELQASYSGRRPTAETIKQALNHKALSNPMYAEFKKTLKYAEVVLRKHDMLETESENSMGISGYLMDVSSLWEAYLAALLRSNFPDWNVKTQEELPLYKDSFFKRSNYPDIVMEKDGEYVILDAKFKHMRLENSDVDRSDLFQINSYAGYYNLKYPGKVKLCGLIYPLSKDIQEEKTKTHLEHLYGLGETELGESNPQNKTKFIIDGVYVGPKTTPGIKVSDLGKSQNNDEIKQETNPKEQQIDLKNSEEEFIERLKELLN